MFLVEETKGGALTRAGGGLVLYISSTNVTLETWFYMRERRDMYMLWLTSMMMRIQAYNVGRHSTHSRTVFPLYTSCVSNVSNDTPEPVASARTGDVGRSFSDISENRSARFLAMLFRL